MVKQVNKLKKVVLETERLNLQEFTIEDADFILELVNSPGWLAFIGDKGVKTVDAARNYLQNGPIKSYRQYGYGLWLVQLKDSKEPIGMCGLVNRDTLEDVDIGFAMLPDYAGKGYGFEAANATMFYAKQVLNIPKVVAITDPNNIASIKLIEKIGLKFEKTIQLSDNDSVLLFSPTASTDEEKINVIISNFFDAFTNINGGTVDVARVGDLCIKEAIIINNTFENPEIYNLSEFIIPRNEILNNGTLIDFKEKETTFKTKIFGSIAQRCSHYEKSGKLNGVDFQSKGVKTFQLIKISDDWKISAIAWNDEK